MPLRAAGAPSRGEALASGFHVQYACGKVLSADTQLEVAP